MASTCGWMRGKRYFLSVPTLKNANIKPSQEIIVSHFSDGIPQLGNSFPSTG